MTFFGPMAFSRAHLSWIVGEVHHWGESMPRQNRSITHKASSTIPLREFHGSGILRFTKRRHGPRWCSLRSQTSLLQGLSFSPSSSLSSSTAFVSYFISSLFLLDDYKLRLGMLSMRVWKKSPARHPRRSLRLDCCTHLTAKDRGSSLSNTAGHLG